MTYETIEFAVEGGVATITLDRPDNANALNLQMANEMLDVSVECATNPEIRVVILTGRGKMFCAGGDLAEMHAVGDGAEAHLLKMTSGLHGALVRFAQMNAPLIVAVNGAAGGGGFSMALAGDYVIASDKARYISAYTAAGLTPDASSTYHLAKHVGLLRAKELMLSNRTLSAEEACDWGMVNKVVPADALMDEARKIAAGFAAGPSLAYGGVKRLLQTAFSDTLETQLDKEGVSISSMMRGHDGPHGVASFLAKQKPAFKGA